MAELNLPWTISNAHGLCIIGSDGKIVADLTPRNDWMDPHGWEQLNAYAEHIVSMANAGRAYDMDDFAIRGMVEDNHHPEERHGGYRDGSANITCAQCRQPWPCPAISAFRQWYKTRRSA